MKLKKLKLNALSEAGLKDKEMSALKGGNYDNCRCSCYWENQSGSSSEDNADGNWATGTESVHGCNQYIYNGFEIETCQECHEGA